MRIVFKLFLIIGLVLVVLIPAGLLIMVVDPHPHVRNTPQMDQADIDQARKILAPLKFNQTDPIPLQSLTIQENELNLLMAYGLAQFIDIKRVAVMVHLVPKTAVVYATIQFPGLFLGKWINLAMAISPRPGALNIQQVWVGRLRVPDIVVQWAANHAHARFMDIPKYTQAISLIQQIQTVDINTGHAFLQFQWDPLMLASLSEAAKKQMFTVAHQKRLIEYHNLLVEQASLLKMKQSSLISMIKPLFQRAMENSALSQDPVAENTAVLQVMAAYATNRDLSGFLTPEIRNELSSLRPNVIFLLHGREDLARHFLSSAAITVSTSSKLARSMGRAKEMEDAHTDSGYSFVDISANEAGIRLGEFAVSGPVNARRLQQRLKDVSHEKDFIPDMGDLPEKLTAEAFQNRFKTSQSTPFSQIIQRIESRINACRIYQN